jgi:hypothetical protein
MRVIHISDNEIKDDFKGSVDKIIDKLPPDLYGRTHRNPDYKRKYEDFKCLLRIMEKKNGEYFLMRKWIKKAKDGYCVEAFASE